MFYSVITIAIYMSIQKVNNIQEHLYLNDHLRERKKCEIKITYG